MIKKRLLPTTLLPITLAASLLLSSCGIKGDLETPPPIWGDKSATAKPVTPDTDSDANDDFDSDIDY